MTTFDHLKLVRRHPRELKRFRRWVLSGQPGGLEHVAIMHEANGRCCRREPWNVTAARIIGALVPAVPQVLINLNHPGE